MQFYTDPSREKDDHALPDAEVFYFDGEGDGMNGRSGPSTRSRGLPPEDEQPAGWYWLACSPGCMPDSDPYGPFATKEEAIADARGSAANGLLLLDAVVEKLRVLMDQGY